MHTATPTPTRVLTILLLVGTCFGQQCKNAIARKDPNDCGEYYLCPLNKPTRMHCSVGLAYSYQKGYCDWADLVEDCDVEKFLDFECPETGSYESPETNLAYAHPTDCAKQLVCVTSAFEDYKKVPRLLSCDYPQVFNPEIGKCDYYKEVKGCETYYDELRKKTAAAAKAKTEHEAGPMPEERRVSRNPTARPVPENRRIGTTKVKISSVRKTTSSATVTTTTRRPTTVKATTQATNEEEYEYDDEEPQKP